MKIVKFTQQGQRGNNEDSFGVSEGLVTVCDGMGGHNHGERASAFVVKYLLGQFTAPRPLNKTEIQQNLNVVQADLNGLLDAEPELENMGTTFTGVFRTPDVWYAAHIGDSRIYLFRPSERKLWHTWDHSLVGELMRNKEITIEAGRFHPMSNRISKAIIAHKEGKPASASIVRIDELKAGDIFLLCSDGVVEAWGDWDLVKLFSDGKLTFEQKCAMIADRCNELSKDNNTAVIVEIDSADAFSYGSNDELEWTSFDDVEADYRQWEADNSVEPENVSSPSQELNDPPFDEAPSNPPLAETPNPTVRRSRHKGVWVLVVLIFAIIAVCLFFFLKPFGNNGMSGGGEKHVDKPQTSVSQPDNRGGGRHSSTRKTSTSKPKTGSLKTGEADSKTESAQPPTSQPNGTTQHNQTSSSTAAPSQPTGRQSNTLPAQPTTAQPNGTTQPKPPSTGTTTPSQPSGKQSNTTTSQPQSSQKPSATQANQSSGKQSSTSTAQQPTSHKTGDTQTKKTLDGSAASSGKSNH